MKTFNRKPALAAMTLAIAALAACATTPPQNAMLSDARSSYDRAAMDPDVVRSAPAELQRANEALKSGEAALQKGDPKTDVDHYAYLAQQRTQSALQAGATARADQAIAASRAQRDRIVIDARTQEAQRAQATAVVASADAAVARQQAADAQAQLAELQARPTDRGMVLTMGDVLFDTGKSSLKDGASQTMDRIAEFMAKNPNEKVRVEGYTDSVGSEEMNLELSQRRADAVRNALVARQVDPSRITIAALGERYAVASNDNAAGRQRNRRIEVVFSDANGGFNSPRT